MFNIYAKPESVKRNFGLGGMTAGRSLLVFVGRDLCVPPPCRTLLGAALLKSTASAVTTLIHSSLLLLTLTKGRRPPPALGWGRRPCGIRRRDCAICGWRFGTIGDFAPCAALVFRWLRPAGISPAAAGDQRLCLWKPRFFEKNRVKL